MADVHEMQINPSSTDR